MDDQGSGEIPNELGDSWFSPEIALGLVDIKILEQSTAWEGSILTPISDKLRMPMNYGRQSDCRSAKIRVVEREKQPRPPAKVPK